MTDQTRLQTPVRRRAAMATALTTIILLAVSVAVAGADSDQPPPPEDEPTGMDTVSAERRDLVRDEDFTGTLGHGTATSVMSRATGTITALPEVGEVIRPGETLYEVDERPVVLLTGDTPMWRALGPDVDDGRDVAQLEQGLVDLGFADDDLTVDGDWTWLTTRAVKDWQDSLGLDDDGAIDLGEVVFAPEPIRVSAVTAALGGDAAGEIVSVTGTDQVVTMAVSPAQAGLVPARETVTVTLPDGSKVPATVIEVGAIPDQNDQLPVTVALDDVVDVPDASEVEVTVVRIEAEDVVAVPVTALVALLEGGYAVEVVAGGSTSLVPVDVGAVLDGWVEVIGQLEPGDEVVTA